MGSLNKCIPSLKFKGSISSKQQSFICTSEFPVEADRIIKDCSAANKKTAMENFFKPVFLYP